MICSMDDHVSSVFVGGLNIRCVKKYVSFLIVSASSLTGSLLIFHPVFFGNVVADGPLILQSSSLDPISCSSL